MDRQTRLENGHRGDIGNDRPELQTVRITRQDAENQA